MKFTPNDYRDVLVPYLPIEHLHEMGFIFKLFNKILDNSKDHIHEPVKFDLHHGSSDLLLFDYQEIILDKMVEYKLLFRTDDLYGDYLINPKIISFLDGQNQLSGFDINPN